MAEQDYVRLAAACHCGQPVKLWAGRGRKPKYCGDACAPDYSSYAAKPLKEGKCIDCGASYQTKSGNRKWCNACRVKHREAGEIEARTCGICSARFSCSARSSQKYCGAACKTAANTARQRSDRRQCCSCGEAFLAYKDSTVTWCSQPCKLKALRGLFSCQHCGVEYVRKKRRGDEGKTFCSRECAFSAKAAKRQDRLAAECRASPYYAKHCEGCGQAGGGRRDWRWCAGCRREQELAASRETSRAINEARHRAAGKVVVCRGCDAEFCPLYGTKDRLACQVCKPAIQREMERAVKDRRDRRIKSGERETVYKRKVFQRDGWRCQLCGIETPPHLIGTYEHNAPELDHKVPVSRDGPHTYANTQCLCRSCNGWKGARTMEEMQALLASDAAMQQGA